MTERKRTRYGSNSRVTRSYGGSAGKNKGAQTPYTEKRNFNDFNDFGGGYQYISLDRGTDIWPDKGDAGVWKRRK